MRHDVKSFPTIFGEQWHRRKPWEIRLNDRPYRELDKIVIHEWDPSTEQFTGRWMRGLILFMLDEENGAQAFGLKDGYCAFTVEFYERHETGGGYEPYSGDDQ